MTTQIETTKAVKAKFAALEHTSPARLRSTAVALINDLRDFWVCVGLDVETFTDERGAYVGFIACKDGVVVASAEIIDMP